tara:strand:+ start:806 stop:1057 length:252 start_codon:yes stop_codon:yes gene_type:complete
MESLINMDLEMFPDITEMLEGVSVGDVVKVSGSFQVKELNEKRFTGSFEDKEGITITSEKPEDEPESEDDTDEDEPESEEVIG